ADGQGAMLSDLISGISYVWRYAFSSGMQCSGGRIVEEANGFVVLLPERDQVVITMNRISLGVIAGLLGSCASLLVLLGTLLWRMIEHRLQVLVPVSA
ncbi:MAG TPA: hypothetical protein VHX44_10775, partial [Planctomycetota bacterium]|nr:hypothetical protein [Planctomycetota bacterium]